MQRIAQSLGKSKRTIHYAIQFAREYPDLNLLNEGKNISWSHIVNKYLTDGTQKHIIKKADLYRMIKEIRELLEHEWESNNQDAYEYRGIGSKRDEAELKCTYIRYLQDQVNKIVEGI